VIKVRYVCPYFSPFHVIVSKYILVFNFPSDIIKNQNILHYILLWRLARICVFRK